MDPTKATFSDTVRTAGAVSLRRFPYPYRAMLAICSDLDETPDRHVYWESMKFLNTTKNTSMGPGLGLEIGNSIYFDMPQDQFSYWNTDDAGRSMIQRLIQSGHIDCLHSFGDLATTRSHAGRALDELSRHDCRLGVWVDHAVAPSNFGADIMHGSGDVPSAGVYHADLTCGFGVQYVWRGRVTSIIGQDVPPRIQGIFNGHHPVMSAKTIVKEFFKRSLARQGNPQYAMHSSNQLLRKIQLRDGNKVWEFIRSNPHWGGVSCGETARGLADVLVESMLACLVERAGVCLLYTHLGKIKDPSEPFGRRTRKALELLARFYHEGKILVTTTRRLLDYCTATRLLSFSTSIEHDVLKIKLAIKCEESEHRSLLANLSGLTLYVPDPVKTWVTLNGKEVPGLKQNGPDHLGRQSVSFPWQPLEFPKL